MTLSKQQRRNNIKLAWILASVALAFFAGFVAKITLFTQG